MRIPISEPIYVLKKREDDNELKSNQFQAWIMPDYLWSNFEIESENGP
jgi:hypothetical protein